MTGEMMVHEFDHEMAQTRKALERVPEDRFDWKPHEKSYSLYQLAAHLSEIPGWMGPSIEMDLLDFDQPWEREVPETKEEILANFDQKVAEARGILAGADAETLRSEWAMKYKGEIQMRMPKGAVVRSFVMNHAIHHRAQLGVYLRLLGVPVPGHYGPTADEPM